MEGREGDGEKEGCARRQQPGPPSLPGPVLPSVASVQGPCSGVLSPAGQSGRFLVALSLYRALWRGRETKTWSASAPMASAPEVLGGVGSVPGIHAHLHPQAVILFGNRVFADVIT